MNEKTPNPTEDSLDNLQIEKVELEIQEIKLRVEKLINDARRPLFLRDWFLKSVVGGLVVVPLLWFYVIEVAIPLFEASQHRLNRELELTLDSLDRVRKQNLMALDSLNTVTRSLAYVMDENRKATDSLQDVRKDLARSKREFESDKKLQAENFMMRFEELSSAYLQLGSEKSLSEKEREIWQEKFSGSQKALDNMKTAYAGLAFSMSNQLKRWGYNVLAVSKVWPNPFSDSTSISFHLLDSSYIYVTIYRYDKDQEKDVEVRHLLGKIMQAGMHTVVWDGTNDEGAELPSGRYTCGIPRLGGYKQTPEIIQVIQKR